MASRARSETARLFVALDLPAEAREAFVEWRSAALEGRSDLRLVAPEALHVTLAFIGHRPLADLAPIAAAVAVSVAGLPAASLRVAGVSAVPPRRPRLFALDLEDSGGRASAVASALSSALAAGGWYEPEKRPFWPHVTFARVRRGERAAPVESEPPGDWFGAREVTLYRSRLSPRGASYQVVARTVLPA